MSIFDFNPLKKLLGDAASQVRGIRADLEKLRQERDLVDAAPSSKADTIKALHSRIDAEASRHMKVFVGALTPLVIKGDPGRIDALVLTAVKPEYLPTPLSLEAGICLAFGDGMKNAAARIVEAMAWPDGAMDYAVKQKRLAELDSRISSAESELTSLVRSARSAGITI